MALNIRAFAVSLALCFGISGARAEELDRQQMQSLDEQVQEIKSDVLGIAAELNLLEEQLLYPSDTQVAVFVSLTQGDTVRLDSVPIQIDGEPVAHYIYSFKELEALQKGGVQRIYVGNVPTGTHGLDVSVGGKLRGRRGLQPTGLQLQQGGGAEAGRDHGVRAGLGARPHPARGLVAMAQPLHDWLVLGVAACAGRRSRRGRRAAGSPFRRGALSTPTRASTSRRSSGSTPRSRSTTASTSPRSTRSSTTSTAPSSRSATSSSTTACTTAPAARSSAVLEGDVDEAVRNEAAYRLARIHFQKDQLDDALHALERIHGEVPEEIRDDIEFLRANVYLASGPAADAVEGAAGDCRIPATWRASRLQPRHRAAAGRRAGEAIEQLDRAGQIKAARARGPRDPRQVEPRARHAALRVGGVRRARSRRSTACASRGRSRTRRCCARAGRTRRPGAMSARWCRGASSPSASRPTPRCRKRCSRFRTPTASSSVHGRAAVLYGRAVETFGGELDKVDASIESIAKGEFLEGAGARGDPPGQGLGDPAAQPARRARDLLPDGADGVARLPDRAPELSRPRGHAQEAGRVAGELRCLRRPDPAARAKLRAAAARSRRRSSASSTRRCACGSSSASASTGGSSRC